MRMSDWSSDVCSSDLLVGHVADVAHHIDARRDHLRRRGREHGAVRPDGKMLAMRLGRDRRHGRTEIGRASCREKSVSVRVDLGGRRILKKKINKNIIQKSKTKTDIYEVQHSTI